MEQNVSLNVIDMNGVEVVDSRDVAQMVERSHNELLKTIRVYASYLEEGEVPLIDFFIESTYIATTGKENPCYLITKQGCDMIANKMIGQKGVLFTAAYVRAFEQMRKQIQQPMSMAQIVAAQANLMVQFEKQLDDVNRKQLALEEKVTDALHAFTRPTEDHWKQDMDSMVKSLCERHGLSLLKTRGQLYEELERATGCSIQSRLTRLRARRRKAGMTYRDAMALTKLDAIGNDKQLRVIFEGIVRGKDAKTSCEDGRLAQ